MYSLLQKHFISLLHALDTSEIVIQTDFCDTDEVFVQANSYGDGTTECQL